MIDAARRVFGSDVRDALAATPLRKLLVNLQWPALFAVAYAFGAQVPGWVWPVVVVVQLAVTVWIGNRLADRDALLTEYIAEVDAVVDAEIAERDAAGRD